MDARRIRMNYRKVDVADLEDWLVRNKVKYTIFPEETTQEEIGNLTFYLEVYCAKHEVAIRIKWETE